jgi:hypothetical protein
MLANQPSDKIVAQVIIAFFHELELCKLIEENLHDSSSQASIFGQLIDDPDNIEFIFFCLKV